MKQQGELPRTGKEWAAPKRSKTKRRRRVPGGKALARMLYFLQQRADQMGETATGAASLAGDPPVRQNARAPKRATPSPYLAAATSLAARAAPAVPVERGWRPIGPFSVPHGQTYGRGPGSRPSVSGRISAIAVDPGNPAHLLIGAAGGGVWESSDGGISWTPRTDDQPSLAIGAVAVDPTNPSIVYAGTGEGDSTFPNSPNLLGAGLLRSSDGGASWTLHAQAPFERQGFYDIAIDPLNGNHLFAAASAGLYESTDGGLTWVARRSKRTWDLSIHPAVAGDPSSTQEIFAGCSDGLFRSSNGGSTWSAVTLPGGTSELRRMEVCHAPSDGNVVYVYASVGSVAKIWRRSVFGGSFTMEEVPFVLGPTVPEDDSEIGQAWYDWFAAVAPNNPNVLYVGAINVHKGVRSAAGQWTWTNIGAKNAGDSVHPDQHAIAFSPADPNVVYVGNDGGIYRSLDGGTSWTSLNKGLCITEVEFLVQHPQSEAWLIAGTQDNGTMRYQGDSVWHHVGDGDGGDCGADATSPYTCYHTFYGMGVAKSTTGGGWDSWTGPPNFIIGPPASGAEDYPNGALFYPPVEVNGPVVVQAGNKVFVSRNGGSTWRRIAIPVVSDELASALAVPTTELIYTGTNAGRIFQLTFANGNWGTPVALTRPAVGYISDLVVDPTNSNRIYAAFTSSQGGGRVFRSDSAGAAWNRADTGIPAGLPVNSIEIDPANPDTVFAAADVGVYVSHDAGAAWEPFNSGLPNALVKDLLFHPAARVLRAGTQARGVWEIAVDPATMPDVDVYVRDSSVDTGRVSPSPSGVDDPFRFGTQAFWWQCSDIKVDSPSFLRPALADIDFEVFSDDQSLKDAGIHFAAGLMNESPQRNKTVRVYVQVHNRGVNPARNVAVKVFFASANVTFPDLPAGFWTAFPTNVVPATSPWQPVAGHRVVPVIDPGRSQIAGFEWAVPASAPNQVALLAIVDPENDSLATTELNVATLVTTQKKCGLKNVMVVNPPPDVGPPVTAFPITVGGAAPFSLEADAGAAKLLRGLVLGKRLAKLARAAGWKSVKPGKEDQADIARLLAERPEWKRQLDASSIFAPRAGVLLQGLQVAAEKPEPAVLLVRPEPVEGAGSVLQVDQQGKVLGGVTLAAM